MGADTWTSSQSGCLASRLGIGPDDSSSLYAGARLIEANDQGDEGSGDGEGDHELDLVQRLIGTSCATDADEAFDLASQMHVPRQALGIGSRVGCGRHVANNRAGSRAF